MNTESIRTKRSYARKGARVRHVDSVQNGYVQFMVDGVFSMQPFTLPLPDFARWAEEEVR